MAPVEGRNVRSMFLPSCLAVIFGIKLLVFFQLYRVSLIVLLENSALTGCNKCSRNAVNQEVVMWPADGNNRIGMSVILADRSLSWFNLCVLKSW